MPFFTKLRDTPESILPGQYLRGNAAGDALVSATKEAVLADLLTGLTPGRYLRVKDTNGVLSLEAVTLEQIASGMTVRWHLAARHAGQLTTTTVATVSGILRGWRVMGSIGVTELGMRVWWESATGTRLTARLVNTDPISRSDIATPIPFFFTASGGDILLKTDRNGIVFPGEATTYLVATIV